MLHYKIIKLSIYRKSFKRESLRRIKKDTKELSLTFYGEKDMERITSLRKYEQVLVLKKIFEKRVKFFFC